VNTLEENDDSDDENTFRLKVQTVNGKVQKQPRFKVKIDATWIVMTADAINEYSDIFTGLGKPKGFRVKLHMGETIQPVAQPHQHIPFQVHKQLERQLVGNEDNGMI